MNLNMPRVGASQGLQQSKVVQFAGSSDTNYTVSSKDFDRIQADVVFVPVATENGNFRAFAMGTDAFRELAILQQKYQGFAGKLGQTLELPIAPSMKLGTKKVVLVGVGDRNQTTPREAELELAKAIKANTNKADSSIAVYADGFFSNPESIADIVEGAVSRATYHRPQAVDSKKPTDITSVNLVLRPRIGRVSPHDKPGSAQRKLEWKQDFALDFQDSKAIGNAVSLAKDLANAPYDDEMNAKKFESVAQRIADASEHITAEIKTDRAWLKANMPAFEAVSRAAFDVDEPAFIKLTYAPPSGNVTKKVAVIGKSVMYDTGGADLKTGGNMKNMEKDMTGGAYAMALMQALSELKPDNGTQVTVYMAATPNLTGAEAYKPGAKIDSAVGKKIEIGNTDAEGRVTLIDAVYRATLDNPDEIITMATLTGHAMNSVGKTVALLTRPQDASLARDLDNTAKLFGEPFQQLDVRKDDFTGIQSTDDDADIRNTGDTPQRGCMKAAAFVMSGLPEGKTDTPFAHWDIAGVMGEGPGWSGDATGIGVKTLIKYVTEVANAKTLTWG